VALTCARRALLAAFGDEAHATLLLRLLHELSDSGLISQACRLQRYAHMQSSCFPRVACNMSTHVCGPNLLSGHGV